jgi:hypothetical protein
VKQPSSIGNFCTNRCIHGGMPHREKECCVFICLNIKVSCLGGCVASKFDNEINQIYNSNFS